jgi:hypothetical protein
MDDPGTARWLTVERLKAVAGALGHSVAMEAALLAASPPVPADTTNRLRLCTNSLVRVTLSWCSALSEGLGGGDAAAQALIPPPCWQTWWPRAGTRWE